MSEAALSIKGVDKIYESRGKGPVHAVKNLDMDVQRGEIVALLGSSGCGKTSTLRMIAGFEEVTRGIENAAREFGQAITLRNAVLNLFISSCVPTETRTCVGMLGHTRPI